MSYRFSQDSGNLPDLLQQVNQIMLDYLNTLSEHSVACTYSPSSHELVCLTETGCGTTQTLEIFQQQILPYLSGSPGSRYWGFVTGGTTPAALLGDWLASSVDQNVMVPGDSIATAVELAVLNQLKDLFSLPQDAFDGVFTTGATASNLVCMATARQWGGHKLGLNIAREGLSHLDQFEIFATTPHASQIKIQGILGFGQNHWTKVRGLPDANGQEGEALDINNLDAKLAASSAAVKIVISSAGTVSTTAFDDFAAISDLCRRYDAWHHCDGAFGLFARCSPQYADLTTAVEQADSITVDCHKWLNVPYDCGVALTRHRALLEEAFTVGAAYLNVEQTLPSLMNRGIENSRRFRALPVWFALTAYGVAGVRTMIESNCDRARQLAEWIEADDHYILLLRPGLNVVLFAGKFEGNLETVNALNRSLLKVINQSGQVFLTPGNYQGQFCFRAALSNWQTTAEDVAIATQVLTRGFVEISFF